MVFEIILAAILIAFGGLSLYISIGEKGGGDAKLLFIMIIGFVCLFGGLWIIVQELTLMLILKRLGGLILAAIGLFMIIGFPGSKSYSPSGYNRTAAFFGIILLVVGLYLLLV